MGSQSKGQISASVIHAHTRARALSGYANVFTETTAPAITNTLLTIIRARTGNKTNVNGSPSLQFVYGGFGPKQKAGPLANTVSVS